MKPSHKACSMGIVLIAGMVAQTPALKQGIAVAMPVASHAAEVRAADSPNAVVVAITANGSTFVGAARTELASLHRLTARTVYVKADAQAQYQALLAVLDALRGKSVVLLCAPPKNHGEPGLCMAIRDEADHIPVTGPAVTASSADNPRRPASRSACTSQTAASAPASRCAPPGKT